MAARLALGIGSAADSALAAEAFKDDRENIRSAVSAVGPVYTTGEYCPVNAGSGDARNCKVN